MKIVKTIKAGHVEIAVREYSDGRFGFDREENGKRKQCRWRNADDAIAEAKERVKLTNAGKIDLLQVSREEWMEFQAWKKARSQSRLVSDVRDELLELKATDTDLDPVWITNLKGSCKLFCEQFGSRNMAEIQGSEIEDWLKALGKAPRTRNNIRNIIVQLFRFARDRKYLPWAEQTAAEQVGRLKIKARADDIEIYTPEEVKKLLSAISEDFLPWAIIGGFAGVRTEEIRPNNTSHKDPLRWEDILWGEKQIFVRPETAKTGRQRYVPIADNLLAWLQPYRKRKGVIVERPVNSLYTEISRLDGVTYRKNALRHSYGSYRNAIVKNIAQVSEEMGNSIAVARRNYERPQPRAIADEWFGIMPKK